MRALPLILIFLLTLSCTFKKPTIRSIASANSSCANSIKKILLQKLNSVEKARSINDLEGAVKGSFAEIGAGQTISGTFFEAQRASETIVKTISAYGKEESDRMYGAGARYVSEQRLDQMLNFEFDSLLGLKSQYPKTKRFFALSNSVTTNVNGKGHGWIGLKFISKNGKVPKTVKVHVNFGASTVEEQHRELGKLGVNLIHSLVGDTKPKVGDEFISELLSEVDSKVIKIDVIKRLPDSSTFGEAKETFGLLSNGKQSYGLFGPDGFAVTDKDFFFRKNILLSNISTNTDNELLNAFSLVETASWVKAQKKLGKGNPVMFYQSNKIDEVISALEKSGNNQNLISLSLFDLPSMSAAEIRKLISKNSSDKTKFIVEDSHLQNLPAKTIEILKKLSEQGKVQILI